MFTFHPFPRLPLELRRHIWEMSMQPREIPIHLNRQYCYSPTKTPAILHSCGESRSHLQSIYTKAFKLGSQPRYIWVNFDLDTIRVDQGWLMAIFAEWTSIRHLALGCSDLGWLQEFYMDDVRALRDIGLRTLTFIDTRGPTVNGPISRLDEVWWEPWSSIVMVELYYRCDPMPFYTRVIAPSDPKRIEINSDDYISQYRAYRKALYAADPEHWGESIAYESETESEDGRERWFGEWVHGQSCKCIDRR